ncbi:PH domain-containing protein [Haloarcula onubensis]|uniref:PH domain-containing protein n=1 Tax=Haloarcula onubensis TaxID=2950539 RepID=A0ABU2FR10_9EURY|nr:PH domain-containing protein [Halomicroarcula sp. S3CR25-11]MDS0283203.1 PH domain-containing protein [Halomicroarcula sp. S3CR25-11]
MRRLHPLSGAVSVGRAVLQGTVFGVIAGSTLAGVLGLPAAAVPLLILALALAIGGFALARYYRFTYAIDGDTLRVESGVIARQSREIPLGRIQNVDVTQGVLNRLLGLAVVEFETAGGATTEATLDAVDEAEAERLRGVVQRYGETPEESAEPDTVTAEDGTEPSTSPAAEPAARPDTEELFTFTTRDLLTYAVVSVRPAAPVLLLIGLPLGIDALLTVVRFNLGLVGGPRTVSLTVLEAFGPPRLVALVLLTALQFLVAALLLSVVLTVVEYYDFRLVREGDDLRYERGLLRRYSGTIPLSKVQTVSVRENVAMRRFGFATLAVETAGYSGANGDTGQGVAIPMAPRSVVYDLARDIEPFGDLEFERAPTRARRRYGARFAIVAGAVTAVGYAVDTVLLGTGYWWLLLGLFVLVPPAAHLRWRHRGVALDEDVFATRTGFWRQTTRVVPYYRVQTVFVGRSPFQRRRDLATVTADTASTSSLLGGDARAYDVDDDRAAQLRDTLRERLYTDLLARKRDRDA